MTAVEHKQLSERAYKNEVLIGVEPDLARRFYMNQPHDAIAARIGESVWLERNIVCWTYWLQWLTLLACIPTAVRYFSWWSTLVIPAVIVAWWLYYSRASVGTQRVIVVTLALLVALDLYFENRVPRSLAEWIVCVAATFFFARMAFAAAAFFIRALVVRNHLAFDALVDSVVFVRGER